MSRRAKSKPPLVELQRLTTPSETRRYGLILLVEFRQRLAATVKHRAPLLGVDRNHFGELQHEPNVQHVAIDLQLDMKRTTSTAFLLYR